MKRFYAAGTDSAPERAILHNLFMIMGHRGHKDGTHICGPSGILIMEGEGERERMT